MSLTMTNFQTLFCTAIVPPTETDHEIAKQQCDGPLFKICILHDKPLKKDDDMRQRLSSLADCHVGRELKQKVNERFSFSNLKSTNTTNEDCPCYCCRDPATKSYNIENNFVSDAKSAEIAPSLLRINKSRQYKINEMLKHSKYLWEAANILQFIPFKYNRASEFILDSTSGLTILLMVVLSSKNDSVQYTINTPSIASVNYFENIEEYVDNLCNHFSHTTSDTRIDAEIVFGRLNSKGGSYAGPLFRLNFQSKIDKSSNDVKKSLINGENSTGERYKIEHALDCWEKKKGASRLEIHYNKASKIVQRVQLVVREYCDQYKNIDDGINQFLKHANQIEFENKISEAMVDEVISLMTHNDEKELCIQYTRTICRRFAWMFRNRCISLYRIRQSLKPHTCCGECNELISTIKEREGVYSKVWPAYLDDVSKSMRKQMDLDRKRKEREDNNQFSMQICITCYDKMMASCGKKAESK